MSTINRNKQKVVYTCLKCNYTTNRKSNYLYHVNRKTPCVSVVYPIIDNRSNILDKGQNGVDESQNGVDESSMVEFQCVQCKKVLSSKKSLNRHLETCNGLHQLQCEICHKMFSSRSCKSHHKRNVSCIPIQMQNQQPTTINNITNNNNNTTNNNNNTTNNNNNTTNNNNNTLNLTHVHNHITVNAFGNENYDYLIDENSRLKQIIENKDAFMQNMIKLVHFDKEHPENHNIMMTNMRSKHVHVYDGEKFVKALKDQTFDKLITDKRQFIISNIEDIGLSDECASELRVKLLRLKLNQDKRKDLKEKVELTCYNNKELIMC